MTDIVNIDIHWKFPISMDERLIISITRYSLSSINYYYNYKNNRFVGYQCY